MTPLFSNDGRTQVETDSNVEHQFIQQPQVVGTSVTDHKHPEGNKEPCVSQKQQHALGGEHANTSSGDVMVTGSSCQPSYVPISKQPLSPPSTASTGMYVLCM